jgi:hypothetical protein
MVPGTVPEGRGELVALRADCQCSNSKFAHDATFARYDMYRLFNITHKKPAKNSTSTEF